ncbi:MAG TPA: polyphosphate kinase 1 [Myxococcota bacterium]|nr:polyphosphate kinase 1 [Myxococcota bacterium]
MLPRAISARAPYLNRELSQLEFIARVLSVAEDSAHPLLERIKFLAISGQNLDHFFQVRVAGLVAQLESELDVRSRDGLGAAAQLEALRPRVLALVQRQSDLLAKELLPKLADAGIALHAWDDLDASAQSRLSQLFDEQIFAVLTPLSVDPAHPFPYISNLSLNLALVVRDDDTGIHRFARVKVPPLLPRFLPCGEPGHFVPIEQVIAAHAEALFSGMEIVSCHPFRVTRDAELALEESEADDLLLAVESGLKRRLRTNAAVRLEVPVAMSEQVRNLLAAELELDESHVYCAHAPLDLGALWSLHALERPELKHPAFTPVTPPGLQPDEDGDVDFFARLRERDLLVHHPYESFRASVEAFLAQAASDPHVLAIKHTLYRTSGPDNPIVRTLIQAAEAGKQVVTLVELTARFDEEANIDLARALEEAGVHVVYGVVGLKAHGKITLVVRREADGIRRYGHVGTGNYNPDTARSYEDLGLLSADAALCADLADLFNYLTGYSKQKRFRKLWVAPRTLRATMLELIQREIDAGDGRIAIKVNGLDDPQLVDALYAASQAGVEIDLLVRGVCCLRPGVPGLSETIRVRSIIGRFLEHSRVFRFGSDARGPLYAIGSADLMARNLDRRVEVVTPVEDPALAARLREMFDALLRDDVLAWELDASGVWQRVRSRERIDAQQWLLESAARRGSPARDVSRGRARENLSHS